MLDLLGKRQRELLGLLLKNKAGLTVDELARGLGITRTAMRQHLSALENDGLVAPGATRPSGGRPEQLHVLTDKGRESFPRQYSWFAQLMIESIKQEFGSDGLRERLEGLGSAVGGSLRSQHSTLPDQARKVEKLSDLMAQMGYSTTSTTEGEAPTIEADNCVFHHLACQNPEICRFDLALLESFSGCQVEHQECMASGGKVCRFRFTARPPGQFEAPATSLESEEVGEKQEAIPKRDVPGRIAEDINDDKESPDAQRRPQASDPGRR